MEPVADLHIILQLLSCNSLGAVGEPKATALPNSKAAVSLAVLLLEDNFDQQALPPTSTLPQVEQM